MAWYDKLNPFSDQDRTVWDYIPVVGGVRDLARGESAGDTLAGFTTGQVGSDIYQGAEYIGGKVKDAFNAPYEQKARGYDAIRTETDRLKKERMGQKDFAYNLADSKYEPTRKAIAALYGDPASWKL